MKNPIVAVTIFTLILAGRSVAQTSVSARSITKHVGETVTVCEKVFSGKRIEASSTILLDLGGFHPNEQFVVVIPGQDRNKFRGSPEVDYDGKDITVTGKVIIYKGKPGILLQNPSRLKLVLIDNDRIIRQLTPNKE